MTAASRLLSCHNTTGNTLTKRLLGLATDTCASDGLRGSAYMQLLDPCLLGSQLLILMLQSGLHVCNLPLPLLILLELQTSKLHSASAVSVLEEMELVFCFIVCIQCTATSSKVQQTI